MSDKKNYTLPIIVMIFLFGMISFVTNLASPMGDILKFQFNVPDWMGILGVFANFIAYAMMGYFGFRETWDKDGEEIIAVLEL